MTRPELLTLRTSLNLWRRTE